MESDSGSDNDDIEDSSNIHSQLDTFREKWETEIKNRNQSPVRQSEAASSARGSPTLKPKPGSPDAVYEKAKELFMNGVWAEQNGLIYEAMEYYRKATKIIPDIDIQMTAQYRQSVAQKTNVTEQLATGNESISTSHDDEECDTTDLCSLFNQLSAEDNQQKLIYCSKERRQRSTHISDLPGEILTYILRWVISSDVDTRSLERLSMVCKGFYVLARDPHLWQCICVRIWGAGCQSFQPYSSWRSMSIEKPHLYFHGVYMNKVELYRQGEATVEKFYPPWMKVVYYRYLRFFPDGFMFMHTSSSDPISVISQLRSYNTQLEGMCKGMYRMKDNQVSCILKRVKRKEPKLYKRYKRNRGEIAPESETTFYMDMSLHNHNSQPNALLEWEKYSMSIYYPDTENETSSDFTLTKQDFPPCKFARVKSYISEAHAPLIGK